MIIILRSNFDVSWGSSTTQHFTATNKSVVICDFQHNYRLYNSTDISFFSGVQCHITHPICLLSSHLYLWSRPGRAFTLVNVNRTTITTVINSGKLCCAKMQCNFRKYQKTAWILLQMNANLISNITGYFSSICYCYNVLFPRGQLTVTDLHLTELISAKIREWLSFILGGIITGWIKLNKR